MAFKNLYSLNVFYSNIEGIDNKELTKICVEAANKKTASLKSNTGYTDTPVDGANKQMVRLRKTIKKVMHEHIDQRLIEGEMWTHVLQPGETTMIHNHRNKLDWAFLGLSWVYYTQNVKVKTSIYKDQVFMGGKIIFQTQIGGTKTINNDFDPDPGDLIIFPSWLSHFTTRNDAPEPRVSISGNYIISNEKVYNEAAYDTKSNIKKITGFY